MLKRLVGAKSLRFTTGINYRSILTTKKPEKSLTMLLPKRSGRDNAGHISTHDQGGRHDRRYRLIDFKRNKKDMPAKVMTIEYDPNRNVNISLVNYSDGDKRYVLHPEGLKVGDVIVSSDNAEIKVGNTLQLENIPVGMMIHNLELTAGKGGQIVRGAGNYALIMSKENGVATVKLPSGEIRLINGKCLATIGQLGNVDWKNVVIGKAGRSRHMGIRPHVRGTAQNPRSHPHGGGEGRSGEGMKQPKTPWGKRARGVHTRNPNKYSNKFIVQRRTK